MKDYLASKNNSNILCRVLQTKYKEMGITDVSVWSESFEVGMITQWAVRSDLAAKHPELIKI